MRYALLRTGTSLLAIAAASCVAPLPPDEGDPPKDDTPVLWNPPRTAPLSCTQVHHGGENRDPDLPNDPTPGTGPIFNALTPSDVPDPGQTYPQVRVETPTELRDVLGSDFQGTIIVPKDVDWDLTQFTYDETDGLGIKIKSHIVLRGERGELCSRPILRSKRLTKHNLFTVIGSDVLIEGIHFIGPMNGERSAGTIGASDGVNVKAYYYSQHRNRNIRIRDNELREWPGCGVDVSSTRKDKKPSDWDIPEIPTREFAKDIVVEQNLIHHNSRDSFGYGVGVGTGAHASVLGNVFEANRHAIASNGMPYSGYLAKFNYVQEGGYKDGGAYPQHFDVHGMGDGGYGGGAGQYYEISSNTFRGEQEYYGFRTRSAFWLRGKPSDAVYFDANVLVHDDWGEAVRFEGDGSEWEDYDFHASNNSFDTDYSKELAVGDFDGDGRTDVFLANGTGWFVSRGGAEPWQFLNSSRSRIQDLGFADMNGDRVTDVVWTRPDGTLTYFPFGAGAPVEIGQTHVPARDLRFADFDGDGKMDVFHRDPWGNWWILYSGHADWSLVATWPAALSELRFGNFDNQPGADVITATDKGWAIRSSAKGGWIVINSRTLSLEESVIADFDGNGRDDVAFMTIQKDWRFAPEGRGALKLLRPHLDTDPHSNDRTLYVGHFDKAAARAQVLTWDFKGGVHHDREFVVWNGYLQNTIFTPRSRLNMR